MCREDSGEIFSDDLADKSDCPGPSSNEFPQQETNTTELLEERETRPEEIEESLGERGNWTAVDVYKIFHQFNRTTTGKEEEPTSQPNISAPQTDLNQTLLAIKQSNLTANITRDNTETEETGETGGREKRSAGSGYYHQPLHISREDDMPVLTVAGAETGVQYHSL